MKTYLTLIIFSILFNVALLGQKQAECWRFGVHAGLNFNNNTVVTSQSSIFSFGGSSSISDTAGQLLFYTNGTTVFDRMGNIMPNGTDLAGNDHSTQSALIVPYPGNPGLYYIFTTDSSGGQNGLQYSIVDMDNAKGLGDVTVKNMPLLGKVDEKLTAVGNPENGYWVMAHEWPGDGFYAYKITFTGLDTVPVVSHVGAVHNDNSILNTGGQMKFSPNGKKLALAIWGQNTLELLNFDQVTGLVTKPFTNTNCELCYGVEFSYDMSKLYVSHYNSTQSTFDIDQYDISSDNDSAILHSRKPIISSPDPLRQLQLCTDKKIYVAVALQSYLDVISQPDSAGLLCNFKANAVNLDPQLSGAVHSVLGLPNFVQSFFLRTPDANFILSDTALCNSGCVDFTDMSLNGADSWHWLFPSATPSSSTDQNPQHVCYSSPGSYTVILIAGNGNKYDTLTRADLVQVYSHAVVSISNHGDTLFATNGSSYQWFRNGQAINQATDKFYVAHLGGSYTVDINDKNGCSGSSAAFVVTGIEGITNSAIEVYPNPISGDSWQLKVPEQLIGAELEISENNGRVIYKSKITGEQSNIQFNLTSGIYLLRVSSGGASYNQKIIRL